LDERLADHQLAQELAAQRHPRALVELFEDLA
jgi:hypothetical protein